MALAGMTMILLGGIAVGAGSPLLSETPSVDAASNASLAMVHLNHRNELLTFRAAPSNRGLLVTTSAGELPKEFELSFEGETIGTPRRVVAQAVKQHNLKGVYIGLGVESESTDGKELEYRMILGEYRIDNHKGPSIQWSSSGVLIRRPVASPVALMAVGLPGGDSLMLTLQEIKRSTGNEPDAITTHTFVNHCPVIGDVITQHYHTDPMELLERQKNVLSDRAAAPQVRIESLSHKD